MLRQLRDVVEGDFVRVTRSVLSVLITIEGHGTDDSGFSVFKGGVATEIGPLLLICVLFSHSAVFTLFLLLV